MMKRKPSFFLIAEEVFFLNIEVKSVSNRQKRCLGRIFFGCCLNGNQ